MKGPRSKSPAVADVNLELAPPQPSIPIIFIEIIRIESRRPPRSFLSFLSFFPLPDEESSSEGFPPPRFGRLDDWLYCVQEVVA